jgi:PAS domain-containing protein
MMATKPRDPDLAYWADLIERLRWAGFLLDRDQRLVWASPDLQRFLGSPAQEELGYGLHVLEALRRDPWRQIATPESQTRLQGDLGRVLISDALARSIKLDVISEEPAPVGGSD